MELTNVSGISSKKAEKLKENGYYCVEDMCNANAAKVAAINGCSPKLIANAQRFVKEETKSNLNSINFQCLKCDTNFHMNRSTLVKHHRYNKCSDRGTSAGSIFDN